MTKNLPALNIDCSDVVFNCPEVSPTIEQIDQTFGATHPGVYDEEKQVRKSLGRNFDGHIFQNGQVTSKLMVHKKMQHFLAWFFMAFRVVSSFLLRVLASKNTL